MDATDKQENTGAASAAVDTIVLEYDRLTDALKIGGSAYSLLLMLDIVGRAHRVLQMRWETEERMRTLAQMQDAARTAALISKVNGKG